MYARKDFASFPDTDEACIERVVENCRESVQADQATATITQSALVHFLQQARQRVLPSSIELKCLGNKRPQHCIRLFGFSAAAVPVADGSCNRIQPLLEAAIKTL